MSINLFDTPEIRTSLLPFTYTRPVSEIRIGIRTIAEKWMHHYQRIGYLTEDYLSTKFPYLSDAKTFVNGALCPSPELIDHINSLDFEEGIEIEGQLVAFKTREPVVYGQKFEGKVKIELNQGNELLIIAPWQIFKQNREQIFYDYEEITHGRKSAEIEDPNTIVYGRENIFLEEGVNIKAAVLNAENGPIYLGKDSTVNEGALIKGAFALCNNSHVNMGAKVKGDSTVGPFSKIGGEVSNSVIFGYSNKGHDGFLGNSVLGEWCNLGADTNTSNLKNNYTNVKIWDYSNSRFRDTGEQFCGLMMGDHAKCGINTMFNTGTVVGVGANIYGAGFPRTYIPSFAWGGAAGISNFRLDKFLETADIVMKRRGVELNDVDIEILNKVYEQTESNRK